VRDTYVVSGIIMIAVATISLVSLFFPAKVAYYSLFVALMFLLVAGIIFYVYGLIRKD